MAERDLEKKQGQFTVSAGELGYTDEDNGTVLLEPDKSYSQTFTVSNDATDDQIAGVLNAVLSLSIGVNEAAEGVTTSGYAEVKKKIVSNYILV